MRTTHPVADPVVRTNEDEDTDTAFQKSAEVVLGRELMVEVGIVGELDSRIVDEELFGYRRIYPNFLPNLRFTEVVVDMTERILSIQQGIWS